MAKTEQESGATDLYDWGNLPKMSHFLVERFDCIVDEDNFVAKEAETQAYTKMLVVLLRSTRQFDEHMLKKLKFDIMKPKKIEDDVPPSDSSLLKVRNTLQKELGFEVVRRLNIDFSKNDSTEGFSISSLLSREHLYPDN